MIMAETRQYVAVTWPRIRRVGRTRQLLRTSVTLLTPVLVSLQPIDHHGNECHKTDKSQVLSSRFLQSRALTYLNRLVSRGRCVTHRIKVALNCLADVVNDRQLCWNRGRGLRCDSCNCSPSGNRNHGKMDLLFQLQHGSDCFIHRTRWSLVVCIHSSLALLLLSHAIGIGYKVGPMFLIRLLEEIPFGQFDCRTSHMDIWAEIIMQTGYTGIGILPPVTGGPNDKSDH